MGMEQLPNYQQGKTEKLEEKTAPVSPRPLRILLKVTRD
jgi:hypothetical protein